MSAEFVDSRSCENWSIGETTDIIRLEKNGELAVTTLAYANNRELVNTIGFVYILMFILAYLSAWLIRIGQSVFTSSALNRWRNSSSM